MKTKIQYLRLKVYLKKKFKMFITTKESLSPMQAKTIKVAKFLIARDSSTLLLSPISNIYHVENGNIFVRLDQTGCYIMNSIYSYYVYLPSSELEELAKSFNRKMEQKTNSIVSAYEQKSVKNLDSIMTSMLEKDAKVLG
jgi:hypothetical protein